MTQRATLLALLLFAWWPSAVLSQTNTDQPKAVQEWAPPKNLAEAQDSLAKINVEIEKQSGDAAKDIREVLVLQKAQVEAIITRFQTQAALPERKSRLTEQITVQTAALAAEEKIQPKDYSKAQVDDAALVKAKQEVERLNAQIAQVGSEIEASTAKKGELLNRLEKSRGEVQKGPLAELTAAKIAVEKAQAEAPNSVALLIERQRLAALKLELETIRYDYDLELKKLGIVDDQINLALLRDQVLKLQLKRADTERQSISARLAALAQQASRTSRSDVAAMKEKLANLPKDQEHVRPLLELELELAELKIEQNKFQKEESDFSRQIDGRGFYGALNSSSSDLGKLIKQTQTTPEEEVLPTSASELRDLRNVELARYEVAKKNLADIRDMLPVISKKVGDASRLKSGLVTRFAEAKETFRNGGGDSSASRWTELGTNLTNEASANMTKVEGFLSKLKTDYTNWERLRASADKNVRFLTERLLWTREESNISVVSLEKALEDFKEGSGGIVEVVKKSATASWKLLVAEENRTRSLSALFFVIIAAFGFWKLSRRLPKTYGWLDAQATEGSNLPLVLAIILRRTDFQLMLAVIFIGAPMIAGLDQKTINFAACVFSIPFFYRLGHVLLDVFVGPGKDEERILNLEENIAETLHRGGRWLINVALLFVPIAIITELSGYGDKNPGVLEVWWLIYESLSTGILLFSVFRPAIVSSVIRGSGIFATSVKSWIFILYPFVVGGILFLYVLGSLRYLEAEQYFKTLFFKSVVVLLVAYIAYRLLLGNLIKGRNLSKEPNPEEFEADSAYIAAGRRLFVDRLTRTFLRIGFLVPVGFLLLNFARDLEMPFLHFPLFGGDSVTLKDIVKAVVSVIVSFTLVRTLRQMLAFVILPRTDLDKGLRYTVSMLVTYSMWTVGAVITLNILRIRGEHIAFFTGALAFGIGFGLQSIVKNFVSGLILLIERPVKVGDRIDVGTDGGSVEKITLRATTVMTWDGTGIVIPNENMVGGTLTNHSLGHPRLRSRLMVGVAYGSDVSRVREILTETVKNHGLTLKRPAPETFFMGFGDSSLDFEVRFWTDLDTHRLRVISDLRFAIDEAFRRDDIEIPFPQRDLHVRSVEGDIVASMSGKPAVKLESEPETEEKPAEEGGEEAQQS